MPGGEIPPGDSTNADLLDFMPTSSAVRSECLFLADELETFEVFNMEGHWDADGTQMIDAIRRSAGNPRIKARPALALDAAGVTIRAAVSGTR